MNLIALDTSTEFLSVAVSVGGTLRTFHQHVGQQHAECLLPTLTELLTSLSARLTDIEGIAFCHGPGAFTGLRIGCGITQGLALVHRWAVYPASTLAVLAAAQPARHTLACIDARMGQVYAAAFVDGQPSAALPAGLYHPETLPLPTGTEWSVVGSGAGVYTELFHARMGTDLAHLDGTASPRADVLLAQAQQGLLTACAVEDLNLLYVRDNVAQKTSERQAK